MDTLTLEAQTREIKGRSSKHMTRAGIVPAELYGHNITNQHLSVGQVEFEKVLRKGGESSIVNLSVAGQITPVLINDIQYHYLTGQPIHIDFYQVNVKEELTVSVPLEFIGETLAVKAMGGTLVKVLTELEVTCLPGNLPQSLPVDISKLTDFDVSITVGDIPLPSGVKVVAEADETVAMVQPPRDMEAEMASQVGDLSQVEGLIKEEPVAEPESK